MVVMREELPTRRHNWSQRAQVCGRTVHLCVGEYEDGRPGEIFLDVFKAGAAMRTVLSSMAVMTSLALQYGAPIEVVVKALQGVKFEPSGPVTGEGSNVEEALSILDYVGSELAGKYLEEKK